LPSFVRSAEGLADEEELRWLEWVLMHEPRLGVVVPGWGGARKLRIPSHGRGKRGGSRVIYLYVELRGRIYLLLAYSKNEQQDLSPAQQHVLQNVIERLKAEVSR
ncbi:MAG TPA: type II toxin-antitoxin system RelE/ParE family toxin, partial [Longimicrobium sp.]|uniref:type II toxin-antitoxin system RelE/ParE family toxin n=1 Tax=Longimicrobium sp. TaxID=2029185 RepID=UPI002EDB38E1